MSAETDQQIARLRAMYPADVFVGGPFDPAVVADAERALGTQLPPTYREFVSRYGALALGPYEIYGLTPEDRDRRTGASGIPSAVWFTLDRRSHGGLPSSLVAILDHDGVEYACLDTAAVRGDGECPVVIWSVPSRAVVVRSRPTFDEYLRMLLADFEAIVAEA